MLTKINTFDKLYQEGVVSAKVWFVNILIILQSIIWQILNNETHVYRRSAYVCSIGWLLIYMSLFLSDGYTCVIAGVSSESTVVENRRR